MKKRKKKKTQAVRILDQQLLRKKKRRWLIKISSTLFVTCVIIEGWLKLHDPTFFPIQAITLEGDDTHTDRKALQQAVQLYTRTYNFFTVNMAGLHERLLQFPWLQSVSISREWPNRLCIQIKEQQSVAVWNKTALLSKEGVLFTVSQEAAGTATQDAFETLPQLQGPLGEQNRVWQTYTNLNSALTRLQLKITKLELTEQQTWLIELDNGLHVVLGKQDLKERLQRLINVYAQLTQDKTAMDYIDLRYSHGMAVKYKEG